MRKFKIGALVLALGLSLCCPNISRAAEGDVEINETNFPDEKFREYLLSTQYGADGVFTQEEIANNATSISIIDQGVTSIKGVELIYPNLVYVNAGKCSGFDVTTVPSTVTYLNVHSCDLTSIDVSGFTNLEKLICSDNSLTSIDVSDCTNLKELNCYNNELSELDLNKNTYLEKLDCGNNQLTALDLSNCTELLEVNAGGNEFAALDISNNAKLKELDISFVDEMTTLDISKNTELTDLDIKGTKIDISAMDLSNNDKLEKIDIYYTPVVDLKSCNFSDKAKANIKEIYTTIDDVSGIYMFSNLETLDLLYTSYDDELDLSNFPKLIYLRLSMCDFAGDTIDLSGNPELEDINIGHVALEYIDLSANEKLESISIYGTDISNIDLSHNTELVSLYMNYNNISTVDVSSNTKLKGIYVENSSLVSMTIPKENIIDSFRVDELNAYEYTGSDAEWDLRSIDTKFDYTKVKNLVGAKNTGTSFNITANTVEYDYYVDDTKYFHVVINAENVLIEEPTTEESTTEATTTEEVTTEEVTTQETLVENPTTGEPTTEATTEENLDNAVATGDNFALTAILIIMSCAFVSLLVVSKKLDA